MIVLLISLAVILVDQITKHYAMNLKGKENIIIIEDFLEFTYLENRGAAFGILQGKSLLFVIIAVLVIAYIIYFLVKNPDLHLLIKISFALIIGGAIGNLIDRLVRGYVVDFIFVRFWGYYDFPVFNVADMAVVIGVILLIILTLFTNEFEEVD